MIGNKDKATLEGLHLVCGLGYEQIGRLLGIPARQIGLWIEGDSRDLTQRQKERLAYLRDDIASNIRTMLFDSSKGESIFHRYVDQVPEARVIHSEGLTPRQLIES